MAIIYGRPDSELDIISDAPYTVEKFEDIDIEHRKLKDELAQEKKVFFEKVPNKISEEEQKLVKMKNDEKITEQEFNEKLRLLEEKKAEGGFTGFSASFKGFLVKNYSKKRAINKIKDKQEVQESNIKEWKENPTGIFNKAQEETISDIEEFDELKEDLKYAGAKGELEVLKKLSELSDDYHILCGVDIELPYWVTYDGRKNLKSAQMDLVVVCPKGVFMIEVKNWSDKYVPSNSSLNPYEQTERAGRVLWITLQNEFGDGEFSVTNVLLSIRGNLPYSHNYRSVFVSSLNTINQFLEKRQDILDEEDIEDIVESLEDFIIT